MTFFACALPTNRERGQRGLAGSVSSRRMSGGGTLPDLLVLLVLHVGAPAARLVPQHVRAPVRLLPIPAQFVHR